jgi:hypothetical protein
LPSQEPQRAAHFSRGPSKHVSTKRTGKGRPGHSGRWSRGCHAHGWARYASPPTHPKTNLPRSRYLFQESEEPVWSLERARDLLAGDVDRGGMASVYGRNDYAGKAYAEQVVHVRYDPQQQLWLFQDGEGHQWNRQKAAEINAANIRGLQQFPFGWRTEPLVPTLCVGKPSRPLCGPKDDAERRRGHSHGDRGNEIGTSPRAGFERGWERAPCG